MYAQKTIIHAPMGKIDELRTLIAQNYLPVVRQRPGFLGAYLLEQTDDDEYAELIQFWDSHASIESFQRTGLLQTSIQALVMEVPGIRIQREGYIIRVAVGSVPFAEAAAVG